MLLLFVLSQHPGDVFISLSSGMFREQTQCSVFEDWKPLSVSVVLFAAKELKGLAAVLRKYTSHMLTPPAPRDVFE